MVVDGDGRFRSQREHPQMATVGVRLEARTLVLAAPGLAALRVPLEETAGAGVDVTVWRDRCRAVDCGEAAAEWFSELLGVASRLVRMPAGEVRSVDRRFAGPGDQVSFADGYPFLLLTQASLDDLNARLDAPLPMNRFRPNIVVAGCLPYAEDGWRRIEIGAIGFRLVKPCARCVITTTDQATGERGIEPLRTLAAYRREGDRVLFGWNMVHEGRGAVSVGDTVRILE